MALWIIFAALTIVALVGVMFPVLRRANAGVEEHEFESAVYRDQLQELERDAERGLISEKDRESAFNEVSRRLLGVKLIKESTSAATKNQANSRSIVVLVSIASIVAIAGFLYQQIGKPQLPDQPQQERIAKAAKSGDMAAMILQVQRFLKKNPKDIRGWRVIAPALKRSQRYSEAADAYAKIMQLSKPTTPLLVDYAESLMLANQGLPTDQSRKALTAALKLDKNYSKARFYWALTLQQDGQADKALKEWRSLRDQNPKNIELQMAVQRQIANLQSQRAKLPTLDKDQRQLAAGMTPKERQAMIGSMVKRLSDRLAEDGNDLAGWLRLIRAHMVLGDKGAAKVAYQSARDNFKDKKEALISLDKQVATFGLIKKKEN